MASFPKLCPAEKGGAAAIAAGLVLLILVGLFGVEEGFWVSYTDGFRAVAWMVICVGAGWLLLTVLRTRTRFFDVSRPLTAERLGMSIAAIALAVVILLAVAMPLLPATDESRLPNKPELRREILGRERALRYYVSAAAMLAGLSLGACPATRFFRK